MDDASSSATLRKGSVLGIFLVGTVLYFAQAVFIPLALALLLSFLLAPLVRGLERHGLGRGASVTCATAVSLIVVAGIGSLVLWQSVDVAGKLPGYGSTIRQKLTAVRGQVDGLERFSHLLDFPEPAEPLASGGEAQRRGALEPSRKVLEPSRKPSAPVKVEIVENKFDLWKAMAGPLLGPLATAGLVLVFAVFMLVQWEDLRDRTLRLSGQRRINVTTRALQEASERVSRYLAVQLAINAGVGLTVGVGLYLIGIPNAPLSGLLFAMLRFIPYVGPWVAAAVPMFFAFASSEGWMPLLLTAALFGVVELLAGQVLEPWLYRAKTGISALGILISLMFWGWMWGGVGLLLATPLTVCLVVAGRYVPQLETISILFGDQRALAPWARLYHRLLAVDPEEAAEIFAKAKEASETLPELYDAVLAPALAMAERDRQSEGLSDERTRVVYSSLRHFAEEDRVVGEPRSSAKAATVLCIAAHSEADHISCVMAAQVLQHAGVAAEAAAHGNTASELIEQVAVQKPAVVVVAVLPHLAVVSAYERSRKLRDLFPDLPIVIGIWTMDEPQTSTVARLRASGADDVLTRFTSLTATVQHQLGGRRSAPSVRLSTA